MLVCKKYVLLICFMSQMDYNSEGREDGDEDLQLQLSGYWTIGHTIGHIN